MFTLFCIVVNHAVYCLRSAVRLSKGCTLVIDCCKAVKHVHCLYFLAYLSNMLYIVYTLLHLCQTFCTLFTPYCIAVKRFDDAVIFSRL